MINEGSDPVRLLALSTSGQPDIVTYPDSKKLGMAERKPQAGVLLEFSYMPNT